MTIRSKPLKSGASKRGRARERMGRGKSQEPRGPGIEPRILGLQRAVGNRAVQDAIGLEPSRRERSPALETRADLPHAELRRANSPAADLPARGPGWPLEPGTRAAMESRFRYGLESVRIHTDPVAASLAHRLNARAVTYGKDIFFGRGQYLPHTGTGRRLVAHELAHVIQQSRGGGRRGLLPPTSPLEAAANRAASAFANGDAPVEVAGASGTTLARQPLSENQCRAVEFADNHELQERLARVRNEIAAERASTPHLADLTIRRDTLEAALRERRRKGSGERLGVCFTEREEAVQRARIDEALQEPLSLVGSHDPRSVDVPQLKEEIRRIEHWLASHPDMDPTAEFHLRRELEIWRAELKRQMARRRRAARRRLRRRIRALSDEQLERELRELERKQKEGTASNSTALELKFTNEERARRRRERRSRPAAEPRTVEEALFLLEEAWREGDKYDDPDRERAKELVQAVWNWLQPITRHSALSKHFGRLPLTDHARLFPGEARERVRALLIMLELGSSIGGHWAYTINVVRAAKEHLRVLNQEGSIGSTSIPGTHAALKKGAYTSGALLYLGPPLVGGGLLVGKGLLALGTLAIGEGKLIAYGAGQAGRTLWLWAAANPISAQAISEFVVGTALEISVDGLEGFKTPQGAALTFGEIVLLRFQVRGELGEYRSVDVPVRVTGRSGNRVSAVTTEAPSKPSPGGVSGPTIAAEALPKSRPEMPGTAPPKPRPEVPATAPTRQGSEPVTEPPAQARSKSARGAEPTPPRVFKPAKSGAEPGRGREAVSSPGGPSGEKASQKGGRKASRKKGVESDKPTAEPAGAGGEGKSAKTKRERAGLSGQLPSGPSARNRPTPGRSERDAHDHVQTHFPADDWETQPVFLNGKRRAKRRGGRNPRNSTQPDSYSKQRGVAVEVKDWDVSEGYERMIGAILDQQTGRAISLPPGTEQWLIVDLRRQNITRIHQLGQRIRSDVGGRALFKKLFLITDSGIVEIK